MKLLDIVVKDAILPKLNATERDEAIAEIIAEFSDPTE